MRKISNYFLYKTYSLLEIDKYYRAEVYPGAMQMVKGFSFQTLPWKQIK